MLSSSKRPKKEAPYEVRPHITLDWEETQQLQWDNITKDLRQKEKAVETSKAAAIQDAGKHSFLQLRGWTDTITVVKFDKQCLDFESEMQTSKSSSTKK